MQRKTGKQVGPSMEVNSGERPADDTPRQCAIPAPHSGESKETERLSEQLMHCKHTVQEKEGRPNMRATATRPLKETTHFLTSL